MRRVEKRYVTLIEMMIVISIIGLIGSVVGYNMRGGLEEGRAFKTREAARKLHEILEFEGWRDNRVGEDLSKIPMIVASSGLVRKTSDVMRDGWGEDFQFYFDRERRLRFKSAKYEEYCERKQRQPDYPWEG